MYKLNVILAMGMLEGPDYYTNIFAEYLKNQGIEYYIININDETTYLSNSFIEFCDRPHTAAFTFNNVIFLLNDVLGTDFWKKKGIPVFDYIVDHPRYYADTLLDPICDLYVFALDMDHVDFIRKFYPKLSGVFFSPNGGTEIDSSIPFSSRQMDVIYMGNCKPAWEFPLADDLPPNIDFFNGVLSYLLNNPMLSTEKAIESFLKENNINASMNTIFKLNTEYAQFIENLARRYFMLEAMLALDIEGIDVHVYGSGWIDNDYTFSDHIHLHGRISLKELMDKIGNAKISLNFIPWFKNGCSEKNFDAMLNGCLCVSDHSGYLGLNYFDGFNIVYFDLNNPKQMAADIRWLLDNPSEAEIIAKKGMKQPVNMTLGSNVSKMCWPSLSKMPYNTILIHIILSFRYGHKLNQIPVVTSFH